MENEGRFPTPEALSYAQERLLLTAVRALIESHPDAASFRESWAHIYSKMYRENTDMCAGQGDYLEDTNAAFRELLPVWESYFPDGPAARSKPPSG